MIESDIPQRPQTSHSCAAGERTEKKANNFLWDQMLRKSTADGFYHAKPRRQSPFRCNTSGDWSQLMGRTSPDNRCGSHVKRALNNDSMRSSFYKTDQFLTPDKIGYNKKTNDGQFRIVKVNHSLWQSDVLNQKGKDNFSSKKKNPYFHQALKTQESNFSYEKQTDAPQQTSPRRLEHYFKHVATNSSRYYGGEGYMHQRRDSKDMIKLIGQMEQRSLSKSIDMQRQKNSMHQQINPMEDYKRKSQERNTINITNLIKNNDLNTTTNFQQFQLLSSPRNSERGRQTSLGFVQTTDSKGFNSSRTHITNSEMFDQKIRQRSGRKMPSYMKDLIQSKKIKDSLQY